MGSWLTVLATSCACSCFSSLSTSVLGCCGSAAKVFNIYLLTNLEETLCHWSSHLCCYSNVNVGTGLGASKFTRLDRQCVILPLDTRYVL